MPKSKSDATEGESVAPGNERPELTTEELASTEIPEDGGEPGLPEATDASHAEPPETDTAMDDASAPESPPEPVETAADPDPEPLPQEAAAVAEPPETHEHEEIEHEEGRSFAARALTFLLVLIAGAIIGIWGAPKLAPLLPSGLAPLADWLSPRDEAAEARMATLESRLDGEVGDMRSQLAALPSPDDTSARIDAATQAAAQLSERIAALESTVGGIDVGQTRQELDRLQAAADSQSAELASLKDQLSGATAASGQLSEDTIAQIDVYRAELDGVRADVGTLRDQVGQLSTSLDAVTARADREIESAQAKVAEIQADAETRLSAAEVASEVSMIRAAIANGQPFAEPLQSLSEQSDIEIPEGITAAASGVPTMAALRDRFGNAAHAAIRASTFAGAGDGVLARSKAFLDAQIASRSLSPKEGAGTDAVLSRMEDRLRSDDLDGALAEADQLPSEAAAAMSGWLDDARLRAGAVDGLADFDAALTATN